MGNYDELLNDANSVYNTKLNGGFHYDGNNTKRMRFKLDSNMQNIMLTNNAKIVLESAFVPDVYDWNKTNKTYGAAPINYGPNILKMKNINGSNWDSMQNSQGNTTLLVVYDPSIVMNPNPERLYNFPIPSNFLRNGYIEFELIYNMENNSFFTITGNVTNSRSFSLFTCSLVIYDVDEEELLIQNTDEVNFKLMKPQNPVFKI